MDTLWQDIRFGFRTLVRNPATSIVALLTLALGIGANTALFSVVDGVLLKPLPYPEPDRLVLIMESNPARGFPRYSDAPPNFDDWRRQNRMFEAMTAIHEHRFNLTGGEHAETVQGAQVTPEFFRVLGIRPSPGRGFLAEEGRPGGARVAVLSRELWQRRFGSDPGILNRQVEIDGESTTVVGVMPPGFGLPSQSEIWTPLVWDFKPETRGGHFLQAVGRMKAGVTLEEMRAEMAALAARLERQYPESNTGWTTLLIPLSDVLVEEVRPALLLLLAAVAFVLLIACANVANLLLARLASREREIAVRTALGAGRARLVRQMVTESLVLFLAGGALGLLLAFWATRVLVALYGRDLPREQEIGLDGRVLLFTLGLSLATGLVFGLVPALSATRGKLFGALKEGGRAVAGGARGRLVRDLLVVGEVAVALALLVGAGLLLQSFARLRAVDPGFRPAGVLTAEIALPAKKFSDDGRRIVFTQELLDRLQAIPGVESADTVSPLPLTGYDHVRAYVVQGRPEPPPGAETTTHVRLVTPGFFRTLGIRVLRGRVFTARDDPASVPVVLVNKTMADRTWPGEDPVGKRLTFGGSAPRSEWVWNEVVGVVADIHHQALDQEADAEVYVPQLQNPVGGPLSILLKTSGEPTRLAGAVRQAVRAIDGDLPVERVRTLKSLVAESLSGSRFQAVLLGLFSGVALFLAAIGVYGVISDSVVQRTHEIGIRMALGARRAEVLRLVIRQGMSLVLSGVALGLFLSVLVLWELSDRIGILLYKGRALDPPTLAAVSLVLLAVALVANWLPARRAMRVEPSVALRSE
ncbi:MAG TPA: ABC transporter permease [Thermoanaerobaculia bacterium]|nr:ABC transporter permease [Thermoanaerobaculia bacterium]